MSFFAITTTVKNMEVQLGLCSSVKSLARVLAPSGSSRKDAPRGRSSLLSQKSFPIDHLVFQSHSTSRGRLLLQTVRASSSESEVSESRRDPEDVRGAIAIGLGLYEQGKYQEALEVFEKGLELPGTGMKRYRCPISAKICLARMW